LKVSHLCVPSGHRRHISQDIGRQALEADIGGWVTAWNDDPKPFIWTKTAEQSSNHSDDF